jgi:hypothetical protein
METFEIFILIFAMGILANVLYFQFAPIIRGIENLSSDMVRFVRAEMWSILIVLSVIAFPFFIYLNYKINIAFWKKLKFIREERNMIKEEIKETESFLCQKLDKFQLEEMTEYIKTAKEKINLASAYKKLNQYEKPLLEKLKKAEIILTELEHKQHLDELSEQRTNLELDIKQLEQEKHRRESEEEQNKKAILRNLDSDENNVYKKEHLTEKEFNVLLENGYSQTNEFCVYEKKLITVLIKQILNHSKSHTFLVWSTVRLLESYPDIEGIQVHHTKDADITFKHKRKYYAIEVETGTLLGKTKQAEEKIKYLNRRYEKRWMIIVSNKDLIWKYRKMGFSTQRNEVEKNLEKMLKNDTRFERVE